MEQEQLLKLTNVMFEALHDVDHEKKRKNRSKIVGTTMYKRAKPKIIFVSPDANLTSRWGPAAKIKDLNCLYPTG